MSILKKETDKLLDKLTPQEYGKYAGKRARQFTKQQVNEQITEEEYQKELTKIRAFVNKYNPIQSEEYSKTLGEESLRYNLWIINHLYFRFINLRLMLSVTMYQLRKAEGDKKGMVEATEDFIEMLDVRKGLLDKDIWKEIGATPSIDDMDCSFSTFMKDVEAFN